MAFYMNSYTHTFHFICKFVKNLYKALDFTPLLLSLGCRQPSLFVKIMAE